MFGSKRAAASWWLLASVVLVWDRQHSVARALYDLNTCSSPIANFSIGTERLNLDHLAGQCVGVAWSDRQGDRYATVVVGATLPQDIEKCSKVSEKRNVPKGWDFSAAGMCGKGAVGRGLWRDCLVHDVCVWANCDRDDAIPGGFFLLRPFGNDPSVDRDCAEEYREAMDDWVHANLGSCDTHADCETGRCGWHHGHHCLQALQIGDHCTDHSDCASGRCAISGTQPTPMCVNKIMPPLQDNNATTEKVGSPLESSVAQERRKSNTTVFRQILRGVRQSLSQRNKCLSTHDCANSYCGYSHTCKPLEEDGAFCKSNAQCESGRCAWSYRGLQCQPTMMNGGFCEEDSDCSSGRCGFKGAQLQCLPRLEDGAPCGSNSDCQSERCAWSSIFHRTCRQKQQVYLDGGTLLESTMVSLQTAVR